jgi:lipopolysaccharide export system permease protein
MNDYFLPAGTINFGKLYRRILYTNPELELESYSVKKYQDSIIVAGDVEGKDINRIIIFDKAEQNDRRIITASRAQLTENTVSRGVISLSLSDVFIHTVKGKRVGDFEYSSSKEMIYNILLKDLSISIRGLTPREMRSRDIYEDIRKKEKELQVQKDSIEREKKKKQYELVCMYTSAVSQTGGRAQPEGVDRMNRTLSDIEVLRGKVVRDRTLQLYWIELYKKFSIPAGCLSFAVLAFPLGLMARKSGRSVGFGIGLLVSIIYWGMLFAGQTLGSRLFFPPFLSMWMPNLLILAAGFILYAARRTR